MSRVAALVFDLFDTLVDLHFERIPPQEHAGRRIVGTATRLHEALSREVEVPFDRFVEVLGETDSEFQKSRYAKGLELPTEERFSTCLDRLGVDRPHLAEVLTEVHMGALHEQVVILDHHVEVMQQSLQNLAKRSSGWEYMGGVVVLGLANSFGPPSPP